MQVMRRQKIGAFQFKLKLSHESAFAILLGLVWTNHTLVSYFRAVLVRLPYIWEYREFVIYFIFGIVLMMALPYMVKRIHPLLILGYLVVCTVYFLNYFLHPENQEVLDQNIVSFLIKSAPLVFVGSCVDLKKHYNMLYNLSFISVLFRFVHMLAEANEMAAGDMHSSYILLPHVCMVVAATLANKRTADIIVSLLGVFTIISFGTRGPLLCLAVLVLLYMVLFQKIHKHIGFFIFVVISGLGIALFYEEILQLLFFLIQKIGMSTRIIDKMYVGDLLDSSGRDIIRAKLMEAISANWFGYGIAGDRTLIGSYAHHLLLELMVSYGVIPGTIIFAVPVTAMVKLLIRKSRQNMKEDSFLLVLIASSFVKLFLSQSYLTEGFLFLLLGIVIAEYRRQNRNAVEERKI